MANGLKQLRVADIVVGRPLPWNIYDSNGAKLIREGFIINTTEEVERLINRGPFVKPTDISTPTHDQAVKVIAEKPKDISPFKVLEYVTNQLAVVLANVESSETDFTEEILKLVKDIQRACDRDSHAAMASLFVLQSNRYAIKHVVDVAVLVEITAKSKGYTREERQSIVAAALTMNISMISLQEKLYRQDTPLTEEQQKIVEAHSKESILLLRSAGVADRLWLKCVLSHHETISGTGYPNKLKGEQYPEEAQLISLADNYCARLSPRAYREPLLHKGILRDILLDKEQRVSAEVAALFIKELGFYPPGMVVQLMSTEIGVVTKRGKKPDSPVVHACMKPQIGNYGRPVKRNTMMAGHKIRRVLKPCDPDITFNIRAVWAFNEG